MIEWKGLHNPERHTAYATDGDPATAWCRCDAWIACTPDDPCKCCLAAEVEALRKENAVLRKVADQQMAENETLWAQVERVRDVCEEAAEHGCDCGDCYVAVDARDISAALDGPDE